MDRLSLSSFLTTFVVYLVLAEVLEEVVGVVCLRPSWEGDWERNVPPPIENRSLQWVRGARSSRSVDRSLQCTLRV